MQYIKLSFYSTFLLLFISSACQTDKKKQNTPCIIENINIENRNQNTSLRCEVYGLWQGFIENQAREGIVMVAILGDSSISIELATRDTIQNNYIIDFELDPKKVALSDKFFGIYTRRVVKEETEGTSYVVEKQNRQSNSCFIIDSQKEEISGYIPKQKFTISPAFKTTIKEIEITEIHFKASTKPLKNPCIFCG